MRESGGLVYVVRALRYRHAYWGDYLKNTKRFLENWNPKSKSIVLVGPSAGFSLPPEFLNRFEQVIAIEPDPLARFIFEKRLNLKPKWIKTPLDFNDEASLSLALGDSQNAVLFCNVLGQVPFTNLHRAKKNLDTVLKDREWASYHDALSGVGIEFDLEDAGPVKAKLSETKEWVYVKTRNQSEIELNAHQAFDLFEKRDGLKFSYWQWRIIPTRTHLIEGVMKRYSSSSST